MLKFSAVTDRKMGKQCLYAARVAEIMTIPDNYIQKIQAVYPNTSLDQLELNQDGMNKEVQHDSG